MISANTLWRIELFGGLRLYHAERTITRFQTQKTGALLAYLSYHLDRLTPREVLIEMLWPDAEIEAARNSLRVALNSLRKQLEPPGVAAGTVLLTDRQNVGLNHLAFHTDVVLFEEALRAEAAATAGADRIHHLKQATSCYRGPLLTGYYDSWIVSERTRLEDACVGALRRLTLLLVQSKEFDQALDIAQRAVAVDPLSEGAHRNLIQLYVGMGRAAAAAQQYREMESLLKEHLNAAPSAASRELVRQLGIDPHQTAPTRARVENTALPGTSTEQTRLSFSAPTSFSRPPVGNLPTSLTRFFGREVETESLRERLLQPGLRLLTLTGPGGVGKTRLAVEIGALLRETYEGRVWFVSLAEITSIDMIGGALATALHLTRVPDRDPLDQAVEALGAVPTLLILDNMEQLIEGAASTVLSLLNRLPELKIIATSRSRLDCEGEWDYTLSLLPAPLPDATPEQLNECASVRLFVDRAQMVRPDFQITPRNAASVAALCTRLEGLPLAIELAAAWASILLPQQMLERLNERFDLLVSQRKDRSMRHRTLRAAIEWSYNLLEPRLQRFFTHLSVFSGGWTIEAAQAVCREPNALEMLRELHTRSLIITAEAGSQLRFRMLESLREYADERLDPTESEVLERAHAAYFLDLVRATEPALVQSGAQEAQERLEQEYDNLRAALPRLINRGESELAIEMSGALWRFWYETARVAEGRRLLQQALAAGSCRNDSLRARAGYGAGRLAACQADMAAAQACFEESLILCFKTADQEGALFALTGMTHLAWERSDFASVIRLLQESLTIRRKAGERWGIACALDELSHAMESDGALRQALQILQESAALRRELGDLQGYAEALTRIRRIQSRLDPDGIADEIEGADPPIPGMDDTYLIAGALLNLGYMAESQGDYPAARAHYEESLTIFTAAEEETITAFLLDTIGQVALRQQEHLLARRHFDRSLQIRRSLGDTAGIAESLHHGAIAAQRCGDLLAADSLLREELALRRSLGDTAGETRCLNLLSL